MNDQRAASGESSGENRQPTPSSRIFDSKTLFEGQNTVLIRHENEFYRLLKTKNGKLILQK